MSEILDRRPLPSFKRWLDDNGDGSRADGFEALEALAQRELARDPGALTPQQLSFFRMWKGMSIAVIELCNIEHRNGRSPEQIIELMPRVLACAAFYSTASVVREDAPMRSIAKVLIEEFRFGAKEAADQYTRSLERQRAEAG